GRIVRIVAGWISRGCLAGLVLLALGCNEGLPIILESRQQGSPDSKWEFISEHLDNGMGFGMGALYDEVHIHRPGEGAFKHGDQDASAVFYIESTYQDGDRPVVQWIDAHNLLIRYPDINKPGRAITQFQGVAIRYETYKLHPPK
ncbi:MAG TPA: hypothetical protein VJ483_09555, partial [Holophagaceae bacterium]|nr:hypothetical protein [Holophagaceae bacterium]